MIQQPSGRAQCRPQELQSRAHLLWPLLFVCIEKNRCSLIKHERVMFTSSSYSSSLICFPHFTMFWGVPTEPVNRDRGWGTISFLARYIHFPTMLLRKKLDLSGAVVFVVVAIVWLVCVFVFSLSAQKGAKVLRIIYLCSSAIAGHLILPFIPSL